MIQDGLQRGSFLKVGSPLAKALAEKLRDEIRRGNLASGSPLPPERDLSDLYSVSRTTVRLAVDHLSREGWLERQAHCRPVIRATQIHARPKKTATDHISVWLWPSTNDFVAANVFRGIQSGLHDSPFRVVVATAGQCDWETAQEREVAFVEQVADDETCAGGLLWPISDSRLIPALNRCDEHGVPIVFMDRQPPKGFAADVVCCDNVGSTRRAVEHLLQLGHRKIGLLLNRDTASSVVERQEGFRRALTGAGIDPDTVPVGRFDPQTGESDLAAVQRALNPLVAGADPVTAIFAINDVTAIAALEGLEARGIRVPRDISLVGFDGLLRWVPGGGRLTSPSQDFFRYGELAAELLLERIADSDPMRPRRHVLLDAPLVVKDSTAAPASPTTGPRLGLETMQ